MEIIAVIIFVVLLAFIGYIKFRRVNKEKDCCNKY